MNAKLEYIGACICRQIENLEVSYKERDRVKDCVKLHLSTLEPDLAIDQAARELIASSGNQWYSKLHDLRAVVEKAALTPSIEQAPKPPAG